MKGLFYARPRRHCKIMSNSRYLGLDVGEFTVKPIDAFSYHDDHLKDLDQVLAGGGDKITIFR